MNKYHVYFTLSLVIAFLFSQLLVELFFVSNTPRIRNLFQPQPTKTITPTSVPATSTPTRTPAGHYESQEQIAAPSPTYQLVPTITNTFLPRPTNTPVPTQISFPTKIPTPYDQPLQNVSCPQQSSQSYSSLSPLSHLSENPATHPDINLSVRGYTNASGTRGLISIDGPTDSKAPQLATLFSSPRYPGFNSIYDVYDWDWNTNRKSGLITYTDIQLAGLSATPGESVRVPSSGYSIGSGYEVLVLYAESNRLTLVYTKEDSIVVGYVVHIEDICVDPNLYSLYTNLHAQGRTKLPALEEGKTLGTARTNEVKVAIRDTGQFMDPRSRKDWWRGY